MAVLKPTAVVRDRHALERRVRFLARRHAPDAEFPYARMTDGELQWLERFLEMEGGGDQTRNHARYAASNDALSRLTRVTYIDDRGHSISPELLLDLAQRIEAEPLAETKACGACGEERPVADFHRMGRGDQRRPVCRFCVCVRSA